MKFELLRSGMTAPENSPDAFEKMVSVLGEMCKCLGSCLYIDFSGKSFHSIFARLAVQTQDHIILLREQALDFLATDGQEFPHSSHACARVLGCNRGCLVFLCVSRTCCFLQICDRGARTLSPWSSRIKVSRKSQAAASRK